MSEGVRKGGSKAMSGREGRIIIVKLNASHQNGKGGRDITHVLCFWEHNIEGW